MGNTSALAHKAPLTGHTVFDSMWLKSDFQMECQTFAIRTVRSSMKLSVRLLLQQHSQLTGETHEQVG